MAECEPPTRKRHIICKYPEVERGVIWNALRKIHTFPECRQIAKDRIAINYESNDDVELLLLGGEQKDSRCIREFLTVSRHLPLVYQLGPGATVPAAVPTDTARTLTRLCERSREPQTGHTTQNEPNRLVLHDCVIVTAPKEVCAVIIHPPALGISGLGWKDPLFLHRMEADVEQYPNMVHFTNMDLTWQLTPAQISGWNAYLDLPAVVYTYDRWKLTRLEA